MKTLLALLLSSSIPTGHWAQDGVLCDQVHDWNSIVITDTSVTGGEMECTFQETEVDGNSIILQASCEDYEHTFDNSFILETVTPNWIRITSAYAPNDPTSYHRCGE